jgi:uncharacterized membrane protein YtjA (UPF0391 family)
MWLWALLFLVLSVACGILAFTTLAGAAYFAAKLAFFMCVALFVIFVGLSITTARAMR